MTNESPEPQTNNRNLNQDRRRGLVGFPSDTARLLTLVLTLLALTLLVPAATSAQTAVPTATTSAAIATPPRTATPTLTAVQAKLVLADTLWRGGNFAEAVKLFSEIATEEPGNPEALRGLKAALDAQAEATAAAVVRPTPAAPGPYPTPTPPFGDMLTTSLVGLLLLAVIGLVMLIGKGRLRVWIDGLLQLWRSQAKVEPTRPQGPHGRPDVLPTPGNSAQAASDTPDAPRAEGTSAVEGVRRHHLKTQRQELSNRYDQLTERIEALDDDLEVETDRERTHTLMERRERAAADREEVVREQQEIERQLADPNPIPGT